MNVGIGLVVVIMILIVSIIWDSLLLEVFFVMEWGFVFGCGVSRMVILLWLCVFFMFLEIEILSCVLGIVRVCSFFVIVVFRCVVVFVCVVVRVVVFVFMLVCVVLCLVISCLMWLLLLLSLVRCVEFVCYSVSVFFSELCVWMRVFSVVWCFLMVVSLCGFDLFRLVR